MNCLRVLIVDDELLIRTGIRNGLAEMDGIEILGECESGAQAIDFILSERPDLVLLDVQMHDYTGLEVVEHIGPERMPAVIFVTAYDEYAVKAFELNAVDYLLKPFDTERLHCSILRARERISSQREGALSEQLQALLKSRERHWPEKIVVKNGERFDFVPVASIDWIESADNYVQLHCGHRQHLLGETLSSLEGRLNPSRFARIHRRRIVNLARVIAVHPMFSGTYEVELSSGARLASGRQYKAKILSMLKN